MQLTFYKKDPQAPPPPITLRKPSLKIKSKRHSQFADFKGLTLREYFARSHNPSGRNSDGSEEKESASFEGLPTNVTEKIGLGVINEDIKGRNATEMGEKQLQKHRQRPKGQSRLVLEKELHKEGRKGGVVRQGVFPACRTNPSQFTNNSVNLVYRLRKLPKDTNRNVSYAEQAENSLLNTKPIHQYHLSPQSVSPRPTLEWQKARVYSYYPQLQGTRGKAGRLKEMLHKIVSQSTPQLKGDFGKCLNLLARK